MPKGSVPVEPKVVFHLSASERSKWISKALAAVEVKDAEAQDVLEIVGHKKFITDVPADLCHRMWRKVKESLHLFSETQKRRLEQCCLAKEQNKRPRGERGRSGSGSTSRSHSSSSSSSSSSRSAGSGGRLGTGKVLLSKREKETSSEAKATSVSVPILRETLVRRDEPLKAGAQKQAEDARGPEGDRKVVDEREKLRRARIGNAFLLGDEDEDAPFGSIASRPLVEKRADSRNQRPLWPERGLSEADPSALAFATGLTESSSTPASSSMPSGSAIAGMGGGSIVSEAQQILQKGAGAFLSRADQKRHQRSRSGSRRSRQRTRTRARRKRSSSSSSTSSRPRKRERSRGRHSDADRRHPKLGTWRSPTPDGHLRGQMRAARKAKMMAQLIQQGQVPRVA